MLSLHGFSYMQSGFVVCWPHFDKKHHTVQTGSSSVLFLRRQELEIQMLTREERVPYTKINVHLVKHHMVKDKRDPDNLQT